MAAEGTIAIIGLGLMGGSLAMALKAAGYGGTIRGSSRQPAVREAAVRLRVVDEVFGRAEDAAREAEMVVLCVPVLNIPELLRRVAPVLRSGARVTDVGSTKGWVVRESRTALADRPAVFVGSHPIAGSEQDGFRAARADLYRGAITVVTPAGAPADAVQDVQRLWELVGSEVILMDPDEHDRRLARTSHLPHMTAALLASCIARGEPGPSELAKFCGPGFRDATRLAEGSPDVWHDIAKTNCDALLEELRALADRLEHLRSLFQAGRWEEVRRFLSEARESRRNLIRFMGDSNAHSSEIP
jgi:prephenate dehydrogenase